MSNTKSTKKRISTFTIAAVLVLSLGTAGALAATGASRVKAENIKEVLNDDGTVKFRMYVNLDENGVPVDLTDEERQEVYDMGKATSVCRGCFSRTENTAYRYDFRIQRDSSK